MKSRLLCLITGFLFVSLLSQDVMAQKGYQEVTIRELNTYDETPQLASDFPDHPMVGQDVEFTAIVVSHPRSSGLANFTPEEDQEEDDLGIGRIHIFVVDTTAYSQGKEGMYMHIVAEDVGSFETLERGDMVTIQGSLEFWQNTVQFDPDDQEWITNILMGGDANPDAKYQELLEPITLTNSDINQIADEEGGTFRFRPEAYSDYINAYVRMEGHEVIGSEIADTDRPNMYWVDSEGVAMQYRDISLRYRNDRNDEQGGYREGYNFRRVEEDGAFRPPSSGSIVNISGFVVWDSFDGAFGLNEDIDESALQLSPMEDGVLWWLGERTFEDPNSGEPWPNDLEVLGFPPVIANFDMTPEQPDAGQPVTVKADISGPEGEEVDDVQLTFHQTRGESETHPMVHEGDGTYSFDIPALDAFTAVSVEIQATTEVELDEDETVSITARFSDGSLDVAGNVLDMTYVYLGDEITDIFTIQRTMDGTRGPSPFEGYEGFGFNIDAVVVSGAEDGFVIVQEADEAWSGLPLASTGGVTELERGQQVTITGGEISSAFNNVFLADAEFTTNGTVEDLDEYIPLVTTSELRTNEGRAYEGMVVRMNDVEVDTPQADAPGNDFGEWALRPQDDPDGRTLRVRNRPAFADITDGLDSKIPNDLNAHMKVGAGFDAVYGLMSHSFGNPKLKLRTLDDLVTEESYTWPVRNISLLSLATNEEDSPLAGRQDTVYTDETNLAEWDFSNSYDGDEVTYRFALDLTGGDFEDPLLSLESDGDGEFPEVTIPSADLIAALNGHLEADEKETFIWTVFLSDGGEEVQVSVKDGPVFEPAYREVVIAGSEYEVSGEIEADLPRTVELNQNYPNPFNPSTVIEYSVPEDMEVTLSVYDILGREVAVLVNDQKTAGSYEVTFDATRLASGMYIYRLQAGEVTRTKQMMFIK